MILEAFFPVCSNFFLNLDPLDNILWYFLYWDPNIYVWFHVLFSLSPSLFFVSADKKAITRRKKSEKTFTRLICTMSTRSPNIYSYFWPAHFRVPRYLARNEFRLGKIFFCLYAKKTMQNERKFTRSHFSCA